MAGNVGLGAAKAVQNADTAAGSTKVKMLWVDTDGCVSAAQYCKYFLSSVTKGIQASVKAAVLAAAQGTFKGGDYIGTLANGGAVLSPFHDFSGTVSAAVQAEAEHDQAGDHQAGTIQTRHQEPGHVGRTRQHTRARAAIRPPWLLRFSGKEDWCGSNCGA